MPNWLESRASNEDEFVLRPGLIVRSQWSTASTVHECTHAYATYRGRRDEDEKKEKKERSDDDEKREETRWKNREIESALTNLSR